MSYYDDDGNRVHDDHEPEATHEELNETACNQCGESIGDSIGEVFGLCQMCWEEYCSRKWWELG